MFDYILRYAINNIWCNPEQDKQFNFKLRRLTPLEGVVSSYVVERERYPLPKLYQKDLWHVFQLGQVTPFILGFPYDVGIWKPLTNLINEHFLDIDVFPSNGVTFPKAETFVLLTESRNLLVAIRENSLFEPLTNLDPEIFLQIYTNSFFYSNRSENNRYKEIFTAVAETQEDVRQFQIKGLDKLEETGFVGKWFVNGRLVNEVSASTAWPGDYLELVIDGSIREVVEFPVKDLKSFKSSLDNERKYILKRFDESDIVDFFDDVDVYLYKPREVNPNIFGGVLYHRNKGNWLRMLTHRDYSIPIASLDAMVASHPIDPRWDSSESPWPKDEWLDVASLTIRLYVKHSGNSRTLINNISRLKELQLIDRETTLRLMTGANSVVTAWRAEELEKSRYLGFMGLESETVFPKGFGLDNHLHPNKEFITNYAADALGYHEASKLVSNSPLKADENGRFSLTYNFWEDSTIFEYDDNGQLLGYYKHTFGDVYIANNSNCYLIEPIAGSFSNRINGFSGNLPVEIPRGYNFRVYLKERSSNKWEDITPEGDQTSEYGFLDTTVPGKAIWNWTHNPRLHDAYLRLDNINYIKKMQFNKSAGMIRFNLDAFEFDHETSVNRELFIPFGQYDVFLDNHPLVEDVDYKLENNRVVIYNLEYLDYDKDVYDVWIRGTGFCSSEIKHFKPIDTGFVEYGVLSSNKKYNLHNSKIKRITVDGKLLHEDDVIFDEANSEDIMTNVRNGSPYQIQHPQSLFREFFKSDYDARVKDDKIDKEVSEYLSEYLPKRNREHVDSITRRHKVFSCASNLLLHLILTKKIKPIVVNGRLNEEEALKSVASYEWIKRYDIVNSDYNTNHIFVYPHWFDEAIGLEWWDYTLYRFLLKSFLIKEIELAPFIFIKRPK